MVPSLSENRFFKVMGWVLLLLVVSGFGLSAIVFELNPLEFPMLFHLHAITYLFWFSLFVFQASLIGRGNKRLHMTLGKLSPVIVLAMLVTGWLMAQGSYERQISPIPDISVQQFTAFPFFDLVGLVVFYGLAIAKRTDGVFHKRAMLLASLAIIEPATARLGMAIAFPPLPLVASLLLVGALIWHDRRQLNRIQIITWFGFAWIFLRVGFVFGFASTEVWAAIADRLFG